MSAKLPKKATMAIAIKIMFACFDENMCTIARIINTTMGATIISVI